MMKLIVFSDSHRRNSSDMLVIIDEEKPDAVLHLGDVVDDADDIRSVYPDLKVYNVRGNNDYGWRAQDVQDNLIVCAGQVKLFLTHGQWLCAAAPHPTTRGEDYLSYPANLHR